MQTTLFSAGKSIFSLNTDGTLTHLFMGSRVVNYTFKRKFTHAELTTNFTNFKPLNRGEEINHG